VPTGYSGTPLAKKLGIKQGHSVALLGAPKDFAIDDLPDGVAPCTTACGANDVIVSFHEWRADLEKKVPKLLDALDVNGGLWIAWPKKASKVPTDVTEDTVREVFLPLGLVDNKVCAIDEVWSGLRLVIRLENRAKRYPRVQLDLL